LGDSALAADACDICCSIVVPVFNEEAVLPVLLRRLDILMAELDGPAETIFVDDASTDCSPISLRPSGRDLSQLLPWATPLMRRIERDLRKLPFGAQYVACGVA
jgi:hypothetical protein